MDVRSEGERRRAEVYADVETLVTSGFLSCGVSVNGVSLAVRSLFLGDAPVIVARVGPTGTVRSWQEWAVASSVWMVEGYNVLGEVNAAVPLRKVFAGLPGGAMEALFSIYTGLFNRLGEALARVEAFCYEDFSRALWRMGNHQAPSQHAWGIAGASLTHGMNAVQRIWTAYNVAEDARQRWDREWSAARFIASATNSKGVSRIASRDESERKLEEERRAGVIAATYARITGRLVGEQNGTVLYRSVSAEELVEEMDRWVRGEKDPHDVAVDAYKDSIRARFESDRAAHEARMAELDAVVGVDGVTGGLAGGGGLVGLTPEQYREVMGTSGLHAGVRQVGDGHKAAYLFDKYIASEATAGGMNMDTGRAVPVSPERGGEASSLYERVASRRVVLGSEGGE